MKKVLIIEDDPFIAHVYKKELELGGYKVDIASDGVMGLEKLSTFWPDLIQLDLMLPKINGVEIIKRIRVQQNLKLLPIVVVSSGYMAGVFEKALEAGATRCISKVKSSPKEVLDTVNQLLLPPPPAPAPRIQEGQVPSPAQPLEISQAPPRAGPLEVGQALPSEVRQQFVHRSPQIQADLRGKLEDVLKCADSARLPLLEALSRQTHYLAGYAGLTGFHRISHLAGACEVLLQELRDKPNEITFSTMGTVANATDCLVRLLSEAPQDEMEFPPSNLILAVDDEPISRQTLRWALAKGHLKAVSVDGPDLALKLLAENRFDLIFLDVDMPGKSGFELCQELRALPANKTTPVIFVTYLSDFQSRAESNLSGGSDFIAKPYLFTELAVKALTILAQIKSP